MWVCWAKAAVARSNAAIIHVFIGGMIREKRQACPGREGRAAGVRCAQEIMSFAIHSACIAAAVRMPD